jgi:predicted Zn finger-like uncharacterized protein
VIIECTNCLSKYQYDEARLEGKPSKKIKCSKCGTIFEIFNPALARKSASAAATAVGDSTFHSKRDEPGSKAREETAEASIPKMPKQTTNLQMPVGKRLSLAIIDGPDAGSVFRIEKPRVTIGRSGADLNLNDTEASRQHAAVEVRDLAYTVSDLGSTNGTLVEGNKILEPTELMDKGEFQIGSSTIMLIVTEDL